MGSKQKLKGVWGLAFKIYTYMRHIGNAGKAFRKGVFGLSLSQEPMSAQQKRLLSGSRQHGT